MKERKRLKEKEDPFVIFTVRVFLAFFWAKITMEVLLSGNLVATSFTFPQKLWSQDEELHDRVDAVDAIASSPSSNKVAHTHTAIATPSFSLPLCVSIAVSRSRWLYGSYLLGLPFLLFHGVTRTGLSLAILPRSYLAHAKHVVNKLKLFASYNISPLFFLAS